MAKQKKHQNEDLNDGLNDLPNEEIEQSDSSEANSRPAKRVDQVVMTWEAPEYLQIHKGPQWYLIAGIVLAATVLLALFTDNWTLALAALAFAGVYQYIHAQHPPKMTTIKITEMGIRVGEMFFAYSHIEAFWLIYEPNVKTLNLRVAKRFYSDVVIQLNHQDPVEVRHFLVGQIPEWEGKTERFSDVLLRLLKL